MDTTPAQALAVITRVGVEIRIPTATWLLCDVCGVLDCEARALLTTLIDSHYLTCDLGGWVCAAS